MRSIDATKTEPGPAPVSLNEHEKWIDVNLKRQTLVAFEGATPVFATVFSSGRNEHETPDGSFRIREKHIAATMDADTAADGPTRSRMFPTSNTSTGATHCTARSGTPRSGR